MMNRRRRPGLTAGTGATLALHPRLRSALRTQEPITRAARSTGERLPVVGLGRAAMYSQVARSRDHSARRDVLRTMAERGGTALDTAPAYGASEQVTSHITSELGVTDGVF